MSENNNNGDGVSFLLTILLIFGLIAIAMGAEIDLIDNSSNFRNGVNKPIKALW